MAAGRGVLVVALACACVFLMGGVTFGIGLAGPTFYLEALWASTCDDALALACLAVRQAKLCCDAQFESLDLVMSIAFFLSDSTIGLWGELADRLGPRRALAIGVSLSCFGSMLLSVSFRAGREPMATTALLTLAVAGPGVFTGSFLSSLAFNASSPALQTATSALTAAVYDASALVFATIDEVSTKGLLPAGTACGIWSALSLCFGIALWLSLQPASSRSTAIATESSSLLASKETTEVTSASGKPEGAGSSRPAQTSPQQAPRLVAVLLTPTNMLVVAYMASLNLPLNFFLQSQAIQMGLAFDDDAADALAELFSLLFPLVAFASALPITLIVERTQLPEREYMVWSLLSLLAHVLLAVMLVPGLWAQRLAAGLFGTVRTLQWAVFFDFIAGDRFPESQRGRVLGYDVMALALVSDTLPYGLTRLVDSDWGDSQLARYQAVKLGLQLLFLPMSIILPAWLRANARRKT